MIVDVVLPAVLRPFDGISIMSIGRSWSEYLLVLIGESGIKAYHGCRGQRKLRQLLQSALNRS